MLLEAMKCLCKVFIYLHILKYVLSWTLKASENIPWILRGVFCLCNGWLEIFPRVYLSLYIKGNKSWIFIGRTDVKAEAPILWPPDVKSWLIGKDPDAGKDWGHEEKGVTEGEMFGWDPQFNEYEFGQTLGDCEGQGSLVCCSPWGHKESDMTEVRINLLSFSRIS